MLSSPLVSSIRKIVSISTALPQVPKLGLAILPGLTKGAASVAAELLPRVAGAETSLLATDAEPEEVDCAMAVVATTSPIERQRQVPPRIELITKVSLLTCRLALRLWPGTFVVQGVQAIRSSRSKPGSSAFFCFKPHRVLALEQWIKGPEALC